MPANPDIREAQVLVAMSGGVDSSVAASLVLEKGYQCAGFTLKLFDRDEADINDAKDAANKLGIPHKVLNCAETFRDKVILPFIAIYEKGATPNPCIECNRCIKFNFDFLNAMELDFDFLATGHYAQIEKSGSRYLLKKALDPQKDQSYVLYSLNQEILARTLFPLGHFSKNEVREIAGKQNFSSAGKRESQDICFVPDGDYGSFIEEYCGKRFPPGDILDPEGKVIGRHRGIIRYTLGQRRGLGVAANDRVYVTAKDMERNTVTLGPESMLFSKSLTAHRINLIACESMEKPIRVTAKTRYLQHEFAAWAVQSAEDEIRVEFDEGQRAVTPGQAAVLYDGDIVIGGGIIKSAG